MIDAKSYLNVTDRTCKHTLTETLDSFTYDMLHAALGISGEAGELLDAVKKSFIYGKVLDWELHLKNLWNKTLLSCLSGIQINTLIFMRLQGQIK
jgi:hypothetical protein